MATTIRLTRMGRKQAPFYRVVVVDSRTRRDGDYIDNIGTYNPMPADFKVELDTDRAIDWLQKGATMSETARSLLRNEGILYRWHLMKQGLDASAIDAKVEEFRAKRASAVEARSSKRAAAKADALKAEEAAAAKEAADAEAAAKAEAEAKVAEAAAESAEASADEAPAEDASTEEAPAEESSEEKEES